MAEWRCPCGVLLGFVKSDGAVEITFKGTVYTITGGNVVAKCRRCEKQNAAK